MHKTIFRKPIHYRELIIAACIAVTMIILGSFFDKNVSQYLYADEKSPYLSMIVSGIAEMPTYLSLVFIGCLLIFCNIAIKKSTKWFIYIFALCVIAFGAYFTVSTAKNIYLIAGETGKLKLAVILTAIIATFCLTGYFAFLAHKISVDPNFDNLYIFKCALAIFSIIVLQLIIVNIIKFSASRPRPYLVFDDQSKIAFKNWYQWNFLYSLKNGEPYLSMPSAHTATASTFAAILPIYFLMSNRCKNSRKLQVGGFYIGLTWGLLTAYARICCGAHFLSDTGWGLLLSVISIVIVLCVIDIHLLREKNYEKAK